MTWQKTPPWADARTLRWVAEQLKRDARFCADEAAKTKAAPGVSAYFSGADMWLGIAITRLRNRATRQERRG